MIFKNTFVSFIYLFIFTKPRVVALVIRAPIATNPLSSQKVILQENCRKSALGMRLEAKALAQRALYSWRGCQYRTSEMTKATPKKATLENKYLRNCDYFALIRLVCILHCCRSPLKLDWCAKLNTENLRFTVACWSSHQNRKSLFFVTWPIISKDAKPPC